MNDKEFIEVIRTRPGVFGLNGSFYPTAMFLEGFDTGRSGGLLRGFREWLVLRRGERCSLQWPLLVLQEALPGIDAGRWKQPDLLTADQEGRAVDHLFSLVLEFLDIQSDPRRLARMYAEYEALYATAVE